ncbi:AraC family transcriptional regulator [Thalassospira alkalitolerans]|uniref:AraC family transcriptional regulator n=1 Tax=Thalassospira alkalitolerans TaxID=1293890 RepID=UPI0030EF5DCA|tara:strand:- start:8198 stop:9139 length:942 start_codon:yes stop_codon:yes gene_type:complete
MKLLFEHVKIAPDRSWRGLHRNLRAIPFEWHFHPEYELTLTLGSQGQRYVGDHIGQYGDDDLVLLGPNLPHTWHSANAAPLGNVKIDMGACDADPQNQADDGVHQAFVFWFTADWINSVCASMPELARLKPVLAGARRGMKFDSATARRVARFTPRFDQGDPADQLLLLIEVLRALLDATQLTPLASDRFDATVPDYHEATRLGRVLDLLHSRYVEQIGSAEIASLTGMSERTLRRFFKRHIGSSVQDYLMGLRLGRAVSLLLSSDLPIYRVAEEAGFQNLSHFNRQFSRHRGMPPSRFRRERFDVGLLQPAG